MENQTTTINRIPRADFPEQVGISSLEIKALMEDMEKEGNVRFRFLKDNCEMSWSEGSESNVVSCGMDGTSRCTPIFLGNIHFTARCTAAWQNENTLEVAVRPMESVFERTMTFRFQGNNVRMQPGSIPSTKSIMDALADGVPHFFQNKILAALISCILRNITPIIEPIHKGRMQ